MEGASSVKTEKELVTHSRKKAFRLCRRLHHFQYELGARPRRQAKPLMTGDAGHKWLECFFIAGKWVCPVAPIDAARDVGDYQCDERDPVEHAAHRPMEAAFEALQLEDPYEAARLRAMVLAYYLRWKLSTWQIVLVEAEFRAPLVNPLTHGVSKTYEIGGKIDLLIDIEDGDSEMDGRWIVEHKTSGERLDDPVAVYWRRLRADPQISDYMIGASAMGWGDVRGVIYDVMGKPKLEPYEATPVEKRKLTIGNGCKACGGGKGKQGDGIDPRTKVWDLPASCTGCRGTGWLEAPRLHANMRGCDETIGEYGMRCFLALLSDPDRYFHRHKVVRVDDELIDHAVDTWFTARSIHETKGAGVATRNPDACLAYGYQCPYYSVCWSGDSIENTELFQITKKHPELSGACP